MADFLVDSNVLVYLVDSKEKKKHSIALRWLGNIKDDLNSYFISTQNLREFVSIALKKGKAKPEKIAEWVAVFRDVFILIEDSSADILPALELSSRKKMHFWDALLATTMKRYKIGAIVTENTKDFRKAELRVFNPFR